MHEPESEKHPEPAREPVERPPGSGKPVELDREAHAEEQGKKAESLRLESGGNNALDQPVSVGAGGASKELLKDGDAKFGDEVDDQNAEQRHPPDRIHGLDALVRGQRRRVDAR